MSLISSATRYLCCIVLLSLSAAAFADEPPLKFIPDASGYIPAIPQGFDILGIKIGDTPQQARSTLTKEIGKPFDEYVSTVHIVKLGTFNSRFETEKYLRSSTSTKGDGRETDRLIASYLPSFAGSVVSGIEREIVYHDQGAAPTMSRVMQSLEAKYGTPSVLKREAFRTRMCWIVIGGVVQRINTECFRGFSTVFNFTTNPNARPFTDFDGFLIADVQMMMNSSPLVVGTLKLYLSDIKLKNTAQRRYVELIKQYEMSIYKDNMTPQNTAAPKL